MPIVSTYIRRRRRRNWSELPDDPLHTILRCLGSYVDFVSFSSVSRSWRAIATSLSPSQITSLFPPLLLSSSITRLHGHLGRHFLVLDPASPSFSRSLDRYCNNANAASLGLSYLSNHGRLLRWSISEPRGQIGLSSRVFSNNVPGFFKPSTPTAQLIISNPFTGEEIYSPIIPKVGKSSFKPGDTTHLCFIDSALLLFTSKTLFYWRIGSPTWSCYTPGIKYTGKLTVAVVKGKVYLMKSSKTLFVLDLLPRLHLRKLAVDGIGQGNFSFHRFLVDYGGELLFLRSAKSEAHGSASEPSSVLEALQLDLSAKRARWVKKETLGNWAIFLGCEPCEPPILGLAVENPERWGGRSNCVYIATGDENDERPWAVIKLGEEIDVWSLESPLFLGTHTSRAASWVHPGL